MMLEQVKLEMLRDEFDFIPQAIVEESVTDLAKHLNMKFEEGNDDFDSYCGIGIKMNNNLPFAVIQYQGHPQNTFTIYLPHQISELEQITHTISQIIEALGLPEISVAWQRRDNPDL